MEKISNIVRGNARVTTADVKSSSAVRPGAPSYGRTVGESPVGAGRGEGGRETPTTASRANVLQNQISEARKASSDRIVEQMADQFFMTHSRRLEPGAGKAAEAKVGHDAQAHGAGKGETPDQAFELEGGAARAMASLEADEVAAPVGYKPRGSYVDVRA